MTIKLELQPGNYPPSNGYLATIHHSPYGVAAGIHWNYKSTRTTRRYLCGLEPPNYPVPAIVTDVGFHPDFVTIRNRYAYTYVAYWKGSPYRHIG